MSGPRRCKRGGVEPLNPLKVGSLMKWVQKLIHNPMTKKQKKISSKRIGFGKLTEQLATI